MRLPTDTTAGKARVCNSCAKKLMELQVADFEEDLDVSTQIVGEIKNSLRLRFAENNVFKRIILDFEVDCTANTGLLDKYAQDPENDAYSFSILIDLAQQRLGEMRAEIDAVAERKRVLVEEHQTAQIRCDAAAKMEINLTELRRTLAKESETMAKAETECMELQDKRANLQESHLNARMRIRELELERREYQERESQGSQRWRVGRIQRASLPASAVESDPGGLSYTITEGREDTLVGGDAHRGGSFLDRVESCRRGACSLM